MLPAIGFFPWILGLVVSAFSTMASWFASRFLYEKALQYSLVTAFLVTASFLTVGVSLAVKAMVIGAQVLLPPVLAQVTYFLPTNINQIFALIVTARLSLVIYRWTVSTFAAYVPYTATGSKHLGI